MNRDEALTFIGKLVPDMFPGADTVFLCGSTARDAAKPGSDIDLVVLYNTLHNGAWRLTEERQGTLVEAFVHDLETLRYFIADADGRTPIPILAEMIAGGIALRGLPGCCADIAKTLARTTLDAGPPPLDTAAIDRARYTISSFVDDLIDERPSHHRLAIAAALYSALGDFVLRAAGRFSGNGKGLAVALEAFDSDLASRFEAAFSALHSGGATALIETLVDDALAPYGGRLVNGYRSEAPADWRRT